MKIYYPLCQTYKYVYGSFNGVFHYGLLQVDSA